MEVKMDVYEVLKKDHQKVADLFHELEMTRDTKEKENFFTELKNELELHSFVEEKIFYPELKRSNQTRETALLAYEEHHVVSTLLEELEELAKDREEWDAKLKVLKEIVEHHVREEEGKIFDLAGQMLSQEKADEIGARIVTEKERQKEEVEAS
jgi:predicted DNA-binding protein YlxM (UPF0122 family)